MTRIGVLGSYGGLNTGDEAILTAILALLRARRPSCELVIFSRNAEHTRRHHSVQQVVDTRRCCRVEVLEAIGRLDLLVLGGGGLLYDTEARIYLREVQVAQAQGVPTVAFAVGAGPLTLTDDRVAVREIVSKMDRVVVRDDDTRRALEDAGVTCGITVTADPALLLEPDAFPTEVLSRSGVPLGERLIGMSVREPGLAAPDLEADAYHALLAVVADFMVHRYDAHVLFVPMEPQDVRHSHAVIAHMQAAESARILHGDHSPGALLGLMQHLDFAVGMRLHFLILAAVAGVPNLPLPYAGKVFDFALRSGVPVVERMTGESIGALLATLDRLWDQRERHAELLRMNVGQLRSCAAETVDMALELVPEAIPSLVASASLVG
jgi:polysaccharide pyruvyl transferase CsaB